MWESVRVPGGVSVNAVPIPASLWQRIVAFLVPGRYGRIELDVVDGRVVGYRFMESGKVEVA